MIPSKPLDIGGIINETIRIVKVTWWRSALFSFIVFLPAFVVLFLGSSLLIDSLEEYEKAIIEPAPQVATLSRDFVLTRDFKATTTLLYKIQFPKVFETFDSVREQLKSKYPNDSAKAALKDKLDSTYDAVLAIHTKASNENRLSDLFDSFWLLGAGCVLLFLGFLAQIAGVNDIACRGFEERKFPFKSIFGLSLKRSMWLLLIQGAIVYFSMLIGIGLVVGLLSIFSKALGVLGFFAAGCFACYSLIRLIFSPMALVSENLGPIASAKRSFDLTQGHFWRVIGIMFVVWIMILVVSSVVSAPFTYSITFKEEWVSELIAGDPPNVLTFLEHLRTFFDIKIWLFLISTALVASLSPAFTCTFYYDLRTRLDGPLDYYDPETSPTTAPPTEPITNESALPEETKSHE